MAGRPARWLILDFLLAPALAAAQPAPAAPAPGIADNSFLLEEAYNQEPGVIQHISSFTRFGEGDWAYAFTEEWPAPSQRHQLRLTLPVQAVGEHSGVGDAGLNYRYQALDGSGGGVAFAPRLSLLLSTGDADRGLGSGGAGLQVNLPLSIQRSSRFVTHSNLGATWIPSARGAGQATASRRGFNAGQSVIWLARPAFHPARGAGVDSRGKRRRAGPHAVQRCALSEPRPALGAQPEERPADRARHRGPRRNRPQLRRHGPAALSLFRAHVVAVTARSLAVSNRRR